MDLRYELKSDSPETLRRLSSALPDLASPWDITTTKLGGGGIYAVCSPQIHGHLETLRTWIPRHMIKSADFGFESIWKVEMPMGVDVPSDIGEFAGGAATVPLACRKEDWHWLEGVVKKYAPLPEGVAIDCTPLSHIKVVPCLAPDSPLPSSEEVKAMWGFLTNSGNPPFPPFSSWQPSFASFSSFPYPQFTAALLWSFATRGWFVWTPDDTFLMPGRDVQRTDLDWLAAEAKRSHKRREVEEG